MVRALYGSLRRNHSSAGHAGALGAVAPLLLALLLLPGCSSAPKGLGAGVGNASTTAGKGMAGPASTVIISRQALENSPKPWVLSTPDKAIRSYLDWTSYAYRIAQSTVATPTMSSGQEVRVDSYVQLNLQKSRVIDQTLDSLVLGNPSTGSTSTLVPAKEKWTYRYVSIKDVGKTVAGPYSATYETIYTVVQNPKGVWVVDSVSVKAIGEVK